ncbi:MAG: hypothetical protein ACTSSK_09075, partial [Candidatus Heimdallarchaeota archaeon]
VLLVVSMEVDLSKLEKFLLKKLQDEVDSEWSDLGSFTPDGPGITDRVIALIEKWLCLKVTANVKGRTMDPSTDRLKGDPEDVHVGYAWIGLAETVPKVIKKPEDLDGWAHLATRYKVTFRDVQYPGPFGFHEGRMVKDFDASGIAEVYEVTERRFQDEAPISKVKEIKIDLNKGKEEKK